MPIVRLLMLAAAMGAATQFVGWIAIPALAAVYALLRRHQSAPREAMLAALAGWLFLIGRLMSYPSFTTLLDRLGKIFPLPGIGVVALTLVLGMILAWSAARVVTGVTAKTES